MLRRIALLACLCACSPTPTATDATPPANPFAVHALRRSERQWREGEIVERISAGPYLYFRLKESGGPAEWFVSLGALTPDAARVRALVVGRAEHFHSSRLGRDFSPLSFAAVGRAA